MFQFDRSKSPSMRLQIILSKNKLFLSLSEKDMFVNAAYSNEH